MRNLRNTRHRVCHAVSGISALCWDAAQDSVLVAHGPTEEEGTIDLVRIGHDREAAAPAGYSSASSRLQERTVASWPAPSPNPDLATDRIVGLHHFGDSCTTCVVLAGGDIVVVQEEQEQDDGGEAHVEIVGSIDAGITAARWSPDEELLAIVTAAGAVVFMSRGFDAIAEAAMTAEDLKASKHVSVGWGKKETQFQGKGAKAKALRDPTIPEKVDEGVLGARDDGRTSISWRGDGAYVAISTVEAGVRRVIRTYSREGVLDSVSEPVDGLEGSLSWRPAGNLMAGIQRLSDRVDVVFFERNGLRHGQFTLQVPNDPGDALDGIALEWNSDSTVLAVGLKDRIQLWTMGNYHWYLKQEIFCKNDSGSGRPLIAWHPEKPLQLAAGSATKLLLDEYIFAVARSAAVPSHDRGAVAVIGGRTVKMTPFRTANVPPPMALFEVEADSSVIRASFSRNNSAMAILHQDGLDLYSYNWETRNVRSLAPKLESKTKFVDLGVVIDEEEHLQLVFSGLLEAYVLETAETSGPTAGIDRGQYHILLSVAAELDSPRIVDSCCDAPGSGMIVQDGSGNLWKIFPDGRKERLATKFPIQLPWVEVVAHRDQLLAFGLSRSGHLYAQARQVAKNCTSFLVTPDHLIFTTTNHLLKFAHLTLNPEDLQVPPDDPENDERCRSIERGARLVTAIPTNMNLVLQMPRGNLETIYPRAMVLAGIRQLIDEKNYARAFSYCRTQRVDMNLLYDHRPEQFLASVDLFLDQLKDVTYIDLFLSSLKEEDVAQTMYRNTKGTTATTTHTSHIQEIIPAARQVPTQSLPQKKSKINTICDAVLHSLHARKNANLQNIITANVCKDPPAIEDGLAVVAELMQEDETLAERAVEHVCFLVDVNRVYDHALGTYNLDLALLVAQQSQRDPREYLPFMQSLHRMPLLRRQFAIDDHLGRREKALGHLQQMQVQMTDADAFDEVKSYMAKHSLYQAALRLYRYDEPRRTALTALYAAHLEAESQFRAAGLAYESIGNLVRATACYQAAGTACWRECLFAARRQTSPRLSDAALADLAATLAEALVEAHDYQAAATVHLEHLHNPEAAVRCLCKEYLFADALRVAGLYGSSSSDSNNNDNNSSDNNSLEAAVDAGLADALSSSTEFLADCLAQLRAQVPRIAELRRKAAEDPLSFYEGDSQHHQQQHGGGNGNGDIPDDVSVAASDSSRLSTSASLFTRYTGSQGSTVMTGASRATSRNRRREEKKRARGRKGTVYEEEYLVNSVRRLVDRVGSTAAAAKSGEGEVERLVFALARRGMAERARAIENLLLDVLAACRGAVAEVWPPQSVAQSQSQSQGLVAEVKGGGENRGEVYRPVGGQAVFRESLEAMQSRQEAPVVPAFARLALLG